MDETKRDKTVWYADKWSRFFYRKKHFLLKPHYLHLRGFVRSSECTKRNWSLRESFDSHPFSSDPCYTDTDTWQTQKMWMLHFEDARHYMHPVNLSQKWRKGNNTDTESDRSSGAPALDIQEIQVRYILGWNTMVLLFLLGTVTIAQHN